jgi:serine/threonine-protein kinase HipA
MNCSGCLKQIDNTGYCRKCLKDLFEGKKVEHVLPFNSPYKEDSDLYQERTKKLSISGVQSKYSMRLDDKKLVLTDKGGQYILKPIPVGQFKHLDQAPANEHLTMQLAGQCHHSFQRQQSSVSGEEIRCKKRWLEIFPGRFCPDRAGNRRDTW